MKILYFCNYFQPMNYGENEISQSLAKLGHDVTIVTGDRYFPFPNYKDTVGKILGARQQKTGKTTLKGVTIIRNKIYVEFAARALFGGIKQSISKLKPDIILVSGISTPVSIQAALFKPESARLIMVDSHLPSELNQGNQLFKYVFYGGFKLFFSHLVSQKVDKVIAVQEGTVDVIKDTYGITKQPVVISHGTDKDFFKFTASGRQKIRKKLRIDSKDFVVITTGKIIAAKGVELLFEAMGTLMKKYPDIQLLVVGDGPKEYREKCFSHISTSLKKRVHLVGFQSQKNLPEFYSSADAAVWPLQESLAMNDAISCELPLIVNNNIGVKERFSNQNAMMYDQGKVADLVNKIEFLYLNSQERKLMGKRGRELVERKMSWIQKAQEYIY